MKPEVALAFVLIAGGLGICLIGSVLRFAALKGIDEHDDAIRFAEGSRYVLALGAAVVFAGVGATAAVQLAQIGGR